MSRQRVTQAEVAAIAGVSQSTVSFVLNENVPGNVRISDETRSRVREAIRITGYSANPVAQRLAGGRNQILGVFTYEKTFPRGGHDFFAAFLVGIEHAAEQVGVDTLLFTSARVVEGRRKLARDGWRRLGVADGCLLMGRDEDGDELQHLLDTRYPFVFVGKRVSEGRTLPYVGADYVSATVRQVDRLAGLGHVRIGYVGPQTEDQPTLDRIQGYREGIRNHGLRPRFVDAHDLTSVADDVVERGITAILLPSEVAPDGVADALAERGLDVPSEVSIVLLGQSHHARSSARAWTGFVVPREEMGARALVLLSRIVNEANAPAGRPSPVPPLDPEDRHQLLECADNDGATVAAPPNYRHYTEGTIRDHA